MTTFPAGQIPTADELDQALPIIRQRGRRNSVSTGSTGSVVGVLRLDDLPVKAGQSYTISVMAHPDSTVLTDFLDITLRYSTDGSTPTTSSSVIPGGEAVVRTVSLFSLKFEYVPASDLTLSLLLCVARNSGTGTCTLFADSIRCTEIAVFSSGADVGDTGTDI